MLLSGVNHMTMLILAQLRDALDSFACRDAAKAVEVWTRDQDIDRLCTNLSREFLVGMMENSVAASFGAHLMFCTKNLERMGDHATNIAEAVRTPRALRRLKRAERRAQADINREHAANPDDRTKCVYSESELGHELTPPVLGR
jgi:phosphate transport system protein